jgi:prepilin peptidase CpaA
VTTAMHLLAILAFAALMAVAAAEDFRRLVIPNWLVLALIAVWPLFVVTGTMTLAAVLGALGIAAAIFLVGALLFARRLLGGGDVKLLCAAALWAGPAATPELLLLTAVLGGVLSLLLLSPFGALLSLAGRPSCNPPGAAAIAGKAGTPVPYAIAIAGAGLVVILQPLFG